MMGNNIEKNLGFSGEQGEPTQNIYKHEQQPANSGEKGHETPERLHENKENREATARHEIERVTVEKEDSHQKETVERSPVERPSNTKSARKKAYKSIMKQTQAELPLASRNFSKLIHNPIIEKASEAAGSTIARPNAMLSGAFFAFLITLAIYIIARSNGYPLSGTETIAGFIAGWVLGLLYDFFRIMITGKK